MSEQDIVIWKERLGEDKLAKFLVEVVSQKAGSAEEETSYHAADYLINASGLNSKKYEPVYPGFLDKYKGASLHMHEMRKMEDTVGEKVMVVGASFGGMDVVWHLLFHYSDKVGSVVFVGSNESIAKSPELAEMLETGKLKLCCRIKEFIDADTILF